MTYLTLDEPLSNFVRYKKEVDNISIDNDATALTNSIENAIDIINNYNIDGSVTILTDQFDKLNNEISAFKDVLIDYKNTVEKRLRIKERGYLQKSYELYESSRENDTPEYIIERFEKHPLITNTTIKKKLIHDISTSCGWGYSGLLIRPSNFDLYEQLISLYPLYVVDEHRLLLDDIKTKWNPLFQSKLRYGIIDDESDTSIKHIPQSQLGFVLVVDFFNYKPLEIIKKYITEIYNLLKPGGMLLFTYNNCNLQNAVRNFENMLYAYTPGTLVKAIVELVGFEIVTCYDDYNSNTNWLKVKKPGTLSSMRGGESLAKIII